MLCCAGASGLVASTLQVSLTDLHGDPGGWSCRCPLCTDGAAESLTNPGGWPGVGPDGWPQSRAL